MKTILFAMLLQFTFFNWTGKKAPEINGGTGWINSTPLKLRELKNKVVLIDFFEYTCVNCLRTLPYLKEWHKRYKDKGLVIIGVHTPEFDFSSEFENVKKAVKELGIEYPVVVDSKYEIWNAFKNQFWPRKFLIDKDGIIRFDHVGEGAYGTTERKIQELLTQINPDLTFPDVIEYIREEDKPGAVCYPRTPEMYAGYLRGYFTQRIKPDEESFYKDDGGYKEAQITLNGWFKVDAMKLLHLRRNEKFTDYVAFKFRGTEVNAVFNSDGRSYDVILTLDDKPIPKDMKGKDVFYDESGRSIVKVESGRMYNLISGEKYGVYTLKLYTNSDAFSLYSFTFGSCVVRE
jgi:thiol-disulfide isomerase/thioredoxin